MSMRAGTAQEDGTKPKLSAEIKAKVQEKNPEFSTNIGDSWDWLFDSIAEAVIEHIVANGRVTVSVVGADEGATLPTELKTRFAALTDVDGVSEVTLSQDDGLQSVTGTPPTPTPTGTTSVVLSAPGLID